MEFEINFRKDEEIYWVTALIAAVIAVLVVFGWIGNGVTPLDSAGNPRLLSWSDWQLVRAERVHAEELSVLQGDATQLASSLQEHPDPVEAQFLVNSITQHAKGGTDPSLADARQALENASVDVRDWASGALDQNIAIEAVQEAMVLLK